MSSPDLALGLQENLIRFVHVLRRLGVPVNPAETLDGLAALGAIGLGDRESVKAALRATLVKQEGLAPIYDRAFDLFFARPEDRQARVAEMRRAREARRVGLEAASHELVFQGERLELTPEDLEVYARLAQEQRDKLRDFLAESSAGNKVDSKFTPLIESIVRGHLERLRRELGLERRSEPSLTGDDDLDAVIEGTLDGVLAGSGGAPGRAAEPLLHLDMKDIAETDLPRATQLIRRLARRLATRLSRRYRETRKRRRPNMRRTIRSNIAHGGVLFDLRFRERRVTRPRLLLICDVSGSMARYTGFILEFIFGLRAAVRGVEAFVFSEELERVTELVDRPTPAAASPGGRGPDGEGRGRAGSGRSAAGGPAAGRFAASARQVVESSRVWGKGTDLGTALASLVAEHGRLLTRETVVIIVSDTKTLGADEAARLLTRMKPKVRELLWLNTLPWGEWAKHRTVALFGRLVNMHECYTLAHLERVIRIGVGRHIRA
jgi:uncharacterized protein with von Willebrand factor type A (vWA) domain